MEEKCKKIFSIIIKIMDSRMFFLSLSKESLEMWWSVQFSCSVVSDSLWQWITAGQASLSITNSWSSLKLTSTESVIPSSHLILCRPLLLLPQSLPASGSFPMKIHSFQWILFIHFIHYWIPTIQFSIHLLNGYCFNIHWA